jgi:hypothetical protein
VTNIASVHSAHIHFFLPVSITGIVCSVDEELCEACMHTMPEIWFPSLAIGWLELYGKTAFLCHLY